MAATATRGSDTDGRSDALYWQGRSLERLGRTGEAHACYALVLEEFPFGYYAAAAERRLGRRAAILPIAREPVPPASLPPAASVAIRRAKTLREAGLVSLATRDLTQRLSQFDADTRRAVLPALPSSGAYDAAFRIAIEMTENGQLSRDEARPYFYPRAHAEVVEHEARKAGIDPVLVYALMRQESAFASTAVSSAKALGLMQLLEKTAKRVAASSGLPEPDAEDLFDPAVNIRLGVRYLAQLSKLFDSDTALMAAAYNAGETAAGRWRDLAKTFDEDEMIEQISYRETRQYVKNILRNMRNYRSIYGAQVSAAVSKS
jgi:soluble lytic murein transglycosylase